MNHFQRYLAEEFAEDYSEGRMSRRQALKLIASVTGSLALATSFLASCAPPPEETATAAADTPVPADTAQTAPTTEPATEPPAEPTAAAATDLPATEAEPAAATAGE